MSNKEAMSDPPSKSRRRIACVRCRRTKKKCDHAVPVCGQCSRAGVECHQLRPQTTGEYVTVPLSYYQLLEAKARGDEPNSNASSPMNCPQDHPDQAWLANAHVPPTPPSVEDGRPQMPDLQMTWDGSYSERTPLIHQANTYDEHGPRLASLEEANQEWPVSQKMDSTDEMVTRLFSDRELTMTGAADRQTVTNSTLVISWDIEVYANVYLAHVHKMYPFLHEDSIRSWMRMCCKGQPLQGAHKGLILRLLCAIGAFMCSSFNKDCPHMKEATSLTQEALDKFHSGSMRQSRVIRAQICLLKLLHAIYGPRSELIHEALASALTACAQLLNSNSQSHERLSDITSGVQSDLEGIGDTGEAEEQIKHIVLACHQVNEIVACGWNHKGEDPSLLLEAKLSTFSERLSVSQNPSLTYLRPFHKIRKTQHKIRLFHEAAERWGLDREAKNKWKAEILQEVDDWMAALNQVEDENGAYAPSSKNYTQKVYDYTICLLHEVDPSIEDLYALLAASSDACHKFRATQTTNKGIILRNWNALVYQFRVGILLLYCFWATPASLRTPAYNSVEAAVNDCSDTLKSFADRWPSAGVFYESFMCLTAQTPFDGVGETVVAWKFPQEEVGKMESFLTTLGELRTHKSVLSIIEAIIRWPPFKPDDTDSFMTAIGLDHINVFELGQAAFGGELLCFDL